MHLLEREDVRCVQRLLGGLQQAPHGPIGSSSRHCTVPHHHRQTKEWFYRALSKKSFPDDKAGEAGFYNLLDSPLRTVIEVAPEKWISFDAAKSAKHRAGELSEEEMSPMLSSDAERLARERDRRGVD